MTRCGSHTGRWFGLPVSKEMQLPKRLLMILSLVFLTACSADTPKNPLEAKISLMLSEAESSAVQLQRAMGRVAQIERSRSVRKMTQALDDIEAAKEMLARSNLSLQNYSRYIRRNRERLQAAHLSHYVRLGELVNETLAEKRKAEGEYLEGMAAWMAYSIEHFETLKKGRDAGTRVMHDRLLSNAVRASKRLRSVQWRYLQFANRYVAEHPELVARFAKEYKIAKA